ncbi:MAG: SRPBCC family protein [Gemmataceae bacterium]|nr:SRPBCC family protein [Gemmataceae bacterium]
MPGTLLKVAAKSAAGPDSGLARAADRYLPPTPTNVSDAERVVSLGVGGALLLNALAGKHLNLLSGLAGGYLLYRAATGHCPGYQALGLSFANGTGPATAVAAGAGVKVEHGVTVNAPVEEVYRRWRDFERLPDFMTHLQSVKVHDDKKSTWTARAPAGMTVRWEAEVVTDTPNQVIAWRSLPGSDVDTAGSVHFRMAPAGRGTEVRVSLKFDPPGGKFGSFVARLFGENPDQQVRGDLRRFKQLVETGETPTVEGQSHGRR